MFAKIPSIRIWDLVLVPLQGEISDDHAAQMSQDVLQEIHESETRGLILDVTGLWLLDSHMCAVLSRLAMSASLMGVETFLCGLSAEIAVTLQSMHLDLRGVTTVSTLEQAFESLDVIGPAGFAEEGNLLAETVHDDAHAPDGSA